MSQFYSFLGIESPLEAVYWIIAITGSVLFLVKLVISFISGDSADGDADDFAGDDSDALSLNTVIAFLKSAGWIGVICFRLTLLSPVIIIPITLLSGIFTFCSVVFVTRRLAMLEDSGTIQYKNAVGNTGRVYLTIPGKGEGLGQIQVPLQGRLMTIKAKSDGDAIPTGSSILVCYIDRMDNIPVVTPFNYPDFKIPLKKGAS